MSDEFDILSLLEQFEAVGLRSKHVCGILGSISETTMSRARTGSAAVPAQTLIDMRNLLSECRELVARSPLPVDWSDLRPVRAQLTALRNERLHPPEMPTETDLEIYDSFLKGDDLDRIAFNFKMSNADVLKRVEVVLRRVTLETAAAGSALSRVRESVKAVS